MSEETQESGMSSIKKTIIGIGGAAATAIGGYVATHIEAIFGGGEEEPKTEQAAQKQESNQSVQVSGPTINLTIPEQKAAPAQIIRERVIEKAAPAPAPAPKKVEDEEDPW